MYSVQFLFGGGQSRVFEKLTRDLLFHTNMQNSDSLDDELDVSDSCDMSPLILLRWCRRSVSKFLPEEWQPETVPKKRTSLSR